MSNIFQFNYSDYQKTIFIILDGKQIYQYRIKFNDTFF